MKTSLSFHGAGMVAGVSGKLPEILVILPSLAIAYAATRYSFEYSGRFKWAPRTLPSDVARGTGTDVLAGPAEPAYLVVGKRQLVTVLQFLVGSLVTFGGTAFTLLAINPFGTALGLGHLSIGIVGLLVGILVAKRKALPRGTLLAVNGVTIAYSLLSVSIASLQSLLPADALHDSLIGTFIAVVMSGTLIYLISRQQQAEGK
jgi:hypothetical protein